MVRENQNQWVKWSEADDRQINRKWFHPNCPQTLGDSLFEEGRCESQLEHV
jgi:hypothetical protein